MSISRASTSRRVFLGAVAAGTAFGGPVCRDSLLERKSVGETVGGEFTGEGWRSIAASDHICYELPAPLAAGKFGFSVRGIRLGLPGDPRKQIFGLFDVFRETYTEENNNGFILRIYTGVKEQHPAGSTRFRLRGPAFGMRGARAVSLQAETEELAWDPRAWYRIGLLWSRTEARWTLDGKTVRQITYPDKGLAFRYAFLNLRRYKEFHGFPGVTFKDVVIG